MTSGDGSPAGGPPNLRKERRPAESRPGGPAWIVVPVRVVALIVLVPLRLVHDVAVQIGRGIGAVFNRLMRAPIWLGRQIGRVLHAVWRGLYRWLLAPVGRLLAAVARGIGALLAFLFVRPAGWFGRWVARLARWLHRTLLVPIGAFLAMIGRGLHRLLLLTGHGLALLFTGLFTGLRLLVNALVVVPAVFLWSHLLRPLLLGLRWLGLVLLVRPAQAVWRYVLAPVFAGLAAAWRLAGRVVRWLWRTLVVLPVRTLVVEPARWVGRSVLRPVGRGLRGVWRASVRDPLRAARRTVRETSRDIRLQLRRAFRG
ncbi:hypothetical protein E1200_26765 [Actinomadura sp. GC306]|uniref:hypothetical protein n=1 Tax=Actinomadura sp. GC306 TaxID=2530367 RepID=UPI0010482702|nr:hypothetical protein [Actinomadura sp. GC306]TDC62152.1 hypothetical protein E1200_26765 [Actinomadura sp. GC306]